MKIFQRNDPIADRIFELKYEKSIEEYTKIVSNIIILHTSPYGAEGSIAFRTLKMIANNMLKRIDDTPWTKRYDDVIDDAKRTLETHLLRYHFNQDELPILRSYLE
jgi:hypothetical protein